MSGVSDVTTEGTASVATGTVDPAGPDHSDYDRHLLLIRRVGFALFAVQLMVLVAFSTVEYHRYALSVGFGTYTQAWTAIAHGHLNPYSTLIGKPFWRNDAEFMVWPLAFLYHIYPHPVDLLWVQDVAVVLTELVTFGWVMEVVTRRQRPLPGRVGPVLALGTLIALIVDPFAYQTIAYDFHSEVLSALFVVLAARALWSGRTRQLWWWVPLALATSGLAGLYVLGVGVSGILSGRRSRRPGGVLVVVGLAWMVTISLIGGNQFGYSNSLAEWYGYLVGPHHGSVRSFDVLTGALSHPFAALHVILSRWVYILVFLLPVGLVGMASSWGWPVAVMVIVPSALNANVAFISPHASFQTWPALPFVLVGSVMVLARLAEGSPRGRRLAGVAAATWAASLIVLASVLVPDVPRHWLAVGAPTAGQLARVDARTPPDTEVISSWGVVGRFGVRRAVFAYGPLSKSVPVERRRVLFVLTPDSGSYKVSPATARRAVTRIEALPGAHTLVAADGVYAVAWTPPSGVRRITLP
jgi:uncharacterized membrane protein